MRHQIAWTVFSVAFLAGVAVGDSIDEAEAKRRGVPVAQVQAENALAKEKLKIAALEKEIANLQKQIEEASGGLPSLTPVAPGSQPDLIAGQNSAATSARTTTTAPTAAAIKIDTSKVLAADDLLAKFPASFPQSLLNARITIKGRIGEARTISDNGPQVTHLMIVGEKQGDMDPTHFSCTMDPAAQDSAVSRSAGELIQISGTVTAITAGVGRVDLDKCAELKVLPAPEWTLEKGILGQWSGQLPGTMPVVAMALVFSPDKSVSAVFNSNGRETVFKGTWSAVPGKGTIARITLEKIDPFEVELEHANIDFLKVPSIPSIFVVGGADYLTLNPARGTSAKIDPKAMQDQITQWLRTNVNPAQLAGALDQTNRLIAAANPNQSGYEVTLGSGATKNHKAAEVAMMNGKLYTFEYSEAQVQKSGLKPADCRTTELKKNFFALTPEVKIDSITFEKKDQFDPSQPLKGSVTLRAIAIRPVAQYALIMENVHGLASVPLKYAPSLDSRTYEFSYPAMDSVIAPNSQPNPLAVFISVVRIDRATGTLRVSESVGELMNIGP